MRLEERVSAQGLTYPSELRSFEGQWRKEFSPPQTHHKKWHRRRQCSTSLCNEKVDKIIIDNRYVKRL